MLKIVANNNLIYFSFYCFLLGIISIFIINHFANAQEYKKAYFAGGCFWCMEESFDQINGVISTISGYSGGNLKNPTFY